MKAKPFIRQSFVLCLIAVSGIVKAQKITTANGEAAELLISKSGEHALRITVKPLSYTQPLPANPALVTNASSEPVLRLRAVDKEIKQTIGKLSVCITNNPLTIKVYTLQQAFIQQLIFRKMDGWLLI